MADSDEGAAVAQVAFQEHVHDVSATGGAVREMPSWSGTLVGYTGRVHCLIPSARLVQNSMTDLLT